MKKLLSFTLAVLLFSATTVIAQGGGQQDPAARLERMKQIYKPSLLEKAKLSEAEADKVIDVLNELQPKMRPIMMDQSLSDDDKKKKMEEINAERDKKFKAIPLSDDQLRNVIGVIDEVRKNMANRQRGGGGGQ